MNQQVTVTAIDQLASWSKNGKTYHAFLLATAELDKPVKVNRLPTSPPIEVGQQLWLENLEVDTGRPTQFKAKVGKPPDQQGSFSSNGSGHDDVTRRSIERQSSLRSAVDYAVGFNTPPSADDVVRTADLFYQWVAQE